MVEKQSFGFYRTIKVSNCSNEVPLILSFDTEGDVITPTGKDGDLYRIPNGYRCIFGTAVHFKANGSEVGCKMNCPAGKKLLQENN